MPPVGKLRLVDLAVLLASAADVGMGQPRGSSLRKAILATRAAEALSLSAEQQASTLYVSLLRWAGCTSHGHEFVLLFDDEIAVHSSVITADFASIQPLAYVFRNAGSGRGLVGRARTLVDAVRAGPSFTGNVFSASCEVAELISRGLGVPAEIAVKLRSVFERFDGRGFPGDCAAGEIPLETRIVQVVDDFVVFADLAGPEAGREVLTSRGGSSLDPELCTQLVSELTVGYESIADDQPRAMADAIREDEPGSRPMVLGDEVVRALRAVAQFTDVKTPFTLGQTEAVSDLAATAADGLGLEAGEVSSLAQAALCYSLGKVSVPNGTWERPGRLRAADWDSIRLYPLHTERLIRDCFSLSGLAGLSSSGQERLDGSGYYRGVTANGLSEASRLLQVAVAAIAMGRQRPDRPALDIGTVAEELESEVTSRRLDGSSVRAVLAVLGQSLAPRASGSRFDLTERELEILRQAVTGSSRRAIGEILGISPHTVDTHLRHIYAKLGVNSRSAAAVVAMQRGLIEHHAIA